MTRFLGTFCAAWLAFGLTIPLGMYAVRHLQRKDPESGRELSGMVICVITILLLFKAGIELMTWHLVDNLGLRTETPGSLVVWCVVLFGVSLISAFWMINDYQYGFEHELFKAVVAITFACLADALWLYSHNIIWLIVYMLASFIGVYQILIGLVRACMRWSDERRERNDA